jgi:hypothetical protein
MSDAVMIDSDGFMSPGVFRAPVLDEAGLAGWSDNPSHAWSATSPDNRPRRARTSGSTWR